MFSCGFTFKWCSMSQMRKLLSRYCCPADSCHMWGSWDAGRRLGRTASPRGTWTFLIRAFRVPASYGREKHKRDKTKHEQGLSGRHYPKNPDSNFHTCLFLCHQPCFLVLITIDAYPSHPEADRRASGVTIFFHALSCARKALPPIPFYS